MRGIAECLDNRMHVLYETVYMLAQLQVLQGQV
jgi:hypothetical protein